MEETQQLLNSIIEGIQDKKGHGIIVADLRKIEGAVCKYFVICQGGSPMQVQAIAESVEDFAREKEGEKPVLTIEAEKEIARVASKTIYTDPVEFNGVSIPQAKVVFGKVEGLPVNLEEDTLYIVSSITVNAFKAHGHDTKQLRLVADTVRNEQGHIVGALSLAEV